MFRLWHLKAYFRFVKLADNTSFNILHTAKKYAENYGNFLELAWIEHSEKVGVCACDEGGINEFWFLGVE